MGKLNPNAVALSLGITASVISLICFILIAILPLNIVIKGTNTLTHGIDMSSIAAKNITLISLITGVVLWFLIAAVIGYIFAFAYNWLIEKF